MKTEEYGSPPLFIKEIIFKIPEHMNYLYLPIKIPPMNNRRVILPLPLYWMKKFLCETHPNDWEYYRYVYVTAKRGIATPGNPLNRPGWHTDGFGTDDINYVWCDYLPTRYSAGPFDGISANHIESMNQFDKQARNIHVLPDFSFARLTPFVVHAAPNVRQPTERCFIKISFSNNIYNLEGNSHNYDLHYNWKMYPRDEIRNDPAQYGRDYYTENR